MTTEKHERITVGHPLEMRSECSCGKPDHLGPDATMWTMKDLYGNAPRPPFILSQPLSVKFSLPPAKKDPIP